MSIGATSIDPWITTIVGALGGAGKLRAQQIANPGAPSNWLGLIGDIAGGYLSGASAQATQNRETQDALAAWSLQSGLAPDELMKRLSYTDANGNTQIVRPKEYHPDVGNTLGQGVANAAAADSLGVQGGARLFGLNPTVANTIFGGVQDAYTNRATLPAVMQGLNEGNLFAGGAGTMLDPLNGARSLPTTNSLIPGAAGALGLGGLFPGASSGQVPAGQIPRANFLGRPAPQAQMGQPQGPVNTPSNAIFGNIQDDLDPLLPDDIEPPQPPGFAGESLRDIFLNSPSASEYRLATNVGGENASRLNANRVSLFNNMQQEETKRQGKALDVVNDKQRNDAYRQQVEASKNAFQALSDPNPEIRQRAEAFIDRANGGAGASDPTKIVSAIQQIADYEGTEGAKPAAIAAVQRYPGLREAIDKLGPSPNWYYNNAPVKGTPRPSANRVPGLAKPRANSLKPSKTSFFGQLRGN